MDLKFEALADDPDHISGDDLLFRRVSWQALGGRERHPVGEAARLNGNAFSDYPAHVAEIHGYPGACMSVHSLAALQANGLTPESLLVDFPDYGLAVVGAGPLRDLRRKNGDGCPQGVMLAPEQGDPAHAVVFTIAGHPRKNPEKEAVAAIARWHVALRNEG